MAIVLSLLALYWLLMGEGAKIANTAGAATFYDHNLLDLTVDTKIIYSEENFKNMAGRFFKSMKRLILNWPWMANHQYIGRPMHTNFISTKKF